MTDDEVVADSARLQVVTDVAELCSKTLQQLDCLSSALEFEFGLVVGTGTVGLWKGPSLK